MLDRAEAAQILQVVDVDMPVVDLVAALAQQIADHVLARPFGAAGRGYRDEIPGGRQLRVETGVDGVEDSLLWYRWCSIALPFPGAALRWNRADQTILCPGLQTFLIAFRIAAAPIECVEMRSHGDPQMPGNRNLMFLIIGALIVAVGVLGYNLYQAKKEPEGVQINVGPGGLKIQSK